MITSLAWFKEAWNLTSNITEKMMWSIHVRINIKLLFIYLSDLVFGSVIFYYGINISSSRRVWLNSHINKIILESAWDQYYTNTHQPIKKIWIHKKIKYKIFQNFINAKSSFKRSLLVFGWVVNVICSGGQRRSRWGNWTPNLPHPIVKERLPPPIF